MTPELFYLLWSVALTVVLVVIAALGAMQQVGLPKLAGNREQRVAHRLKAETPPIGSP